SPSLWFHLWCRCLNLFQCLWYLQSLYLELWVLNLQSPGLSSVRHLDFCNPGSARQVRLHILNYLQIAKNPVMWQSPGLYHMGLSLDDIHTRPVCMPCLKNQMGCMCQSLPVRQMVGDCLEQVGLDCYMHESRKNLQRMKMTWICSFAYSQLRP